MSYNQQKTLVPKIPTDEMVEAALLQRHGAVTLARLKTKPGSYAERTRSMRESLAAAIAVGCGSLSSGDDHAKRPSANTTRGDSQIIE